MHGVLLTTRPARRVVPREAKAMHMPAKKTEPKMSSSASSVDGR